MQEKLKKQPVSNVQWMERDQLKPNDYNPNAVAPPELELLKTSIKEDGWTQPIVARSTGEIVDGFHRWTVSGHDDMLAIFGPYVPVVRLSDDVPREQQMMATIRHNRARGTHSVIKMGEILENIRDAGVSDEEAQERLSMDEEEHGRLSDNLTMYQTAGDTEYSKAWEPEFD